MEQLIAIVAGAVAVAVAPLVPAARPVAKSVVKGGLALGAAAAGAAAVAGKQFEQLRDSVTALRNPATPPAEAAIAPETAAAAADVTAATASILPEQDAASAPAVTEHQGGAAAEAVIPALHEDVGHDIAPEPAPERSADSAAAKVTGTGSESVAVAAAAPSFAGDDLTRISGIGPKTAALLADAGFVSYASLAAASEGELRAVLLNAGPRFRLIDPSAWPTQAGRLLSESAQ